METNALIVNQFTGGPTDFPLQGSPNEYQRAENLCFDPTGKLITRPGSNVFNTTVYQIPAGSQRIGSIWSFEDNLFVQSLRNIYIANPSTWTTLGVNPALGEQGSDNFISKTFWNGHTFVASDSFTKPIKIYRDGQTSQYVVRTAGMPAITGVTASGTAGGNNYLYALTYSYTYTIGNLTFNDEGPTFLVQASNLNAPNVNAITLNTIPVIGNGSTDNYDTANVKVRIYRTSNNGQEFFFVTEITNGTTSYADSASDTAIQDNELIYTTGGVLDNEPPPRAKYLHVVNGVAYYAHVKEGNEINPYKVMQSIPDDPDSVPATFFTEVTEPITGVSSFNSNPLVFTENKIFRIEGVLDEIGQGNMAAIEYSETIGALNHNSIVQTKVGVFFCGRDGFYFTDGYNIQRVSEKMYVTYGLYTEDSSQRSKIVGAYDREKDIVYWAMVSENGTDCDTIFQLDLRFGVRPNSAITYWTGGTSFAPTGICLHSGQLHRGDTRGYIFFHDDSIFTDRKMDTSLTPSVWQKMTIRYNYISAAMDFGDETIRKWAGSMLLSVKSRSNVSVQPGSNNDDGSSFRELKPLIDYSQPVWGDPAVLWGDASIRWNYVTLVQQKRRFTAGELRCNYKQIQFTNAYANIWNSDRFERATVDPSTHTATLPTLEWTTDIIDYYISFEDDNYEEQYLITAVSGDTLTYTLDVPTAQTDPSAGAKKWLIRGYAKGHVLHLLGYTIYFSPFTRSFKPYQGEVGGNA